MRYRVLDPLRGLAALWVFLYHYGFSENFQQAYPWVHEWLKFGNRGVPMFFVISGFCITVSAISSQRHGESPGHFLARRALRIYSTFWCSIVVILALRMLPILSAAWQDGTAITLPPQLKSYDVWDWLKLVTLTRIFDQSDWAYWARFVAINGAYWSLAIEFQFYVVVALSFLRPRWFVPGLALVTATSLLVYATPLWSQRNGFFLPYWPWFACGVGLAFLFQNGITPHRVFRRWAVPVASVTIAVLVSGYATFIVLGPQQIYEAVLGELDFNTFRWIERGVFSVLFTVGLWMGHAIDHAIGDRQLPSGMLWLPARWFTRLAFTLGAMSYSLYLMHNEIYQLLQNVMPFRGQGHDVAVIVATCVAIYPFYRYCEVPFVHLSSRKRRPLATQSSPREIVDPNAEQTAPEREVVSRQVSRRAA